MPRTDLLVLLSFCGAAVAQPCEPHWEAFPAPFSGGDIRAVHQVEQGPMAGLYVGGLFGQASPVGSTAIARSSGESWTALGAGLTWNYGGVNCCSLADAIAEFGGELVAGGAYLQAGNVTRWGLARWNGSSWNGLGTGLRLDNCNDCGPWVYDLLNWNGSLYVGGWFTRAGGLVSNSIARWDGQAWTALDSGFGPGASWKIWFFVGVRDLEVFQGMLYAAGLFGRAGQIQTEGIARWNGSAWEDVGGGLRYAGFSPNDHPVGTSLAVHDDGSGPALYVGGTFDGAGGISARNIARWDGIVWSAVGDLFPSQGGQTRALASFDDGSGPALFAAGSFTGAYNRIAKWNGTQWRSLQSGVPDNSISMLEPVTLNGITHLVVGGDFTSAGGVSSPNLALWSSCPCYANCDQSARAPVLSANDFQCFLNRFAAGEPYANCDGSTTNPALTAADFQCFLNRFAAGCP